MTYNWKHMEPLVFTLTDGSVVRMRFTQRQGNCIYGVPPVGEGLGIIRVYASEVVDVKSDVDIVSDTTTMYNIDEEDKSSDYYAEGGDNA